MPGFDLTAAQVILKEDYTDTVADQLVNDNYVAFKLQQNVKKATGKRFFLPVHTGRNNGVGYRGENQTLPTAGSQQYQQSTANCKYLYGSIQLSGPTIYSAVGNKGAFINALDSEMKGLLKDLKDQRSRAMFGDGTGRLATFAVNTSVNTLTVDQVKYLQVGMNIDIVNSGNTVSVSNRQITNINKAAKTITINGAAVTTAATDYIVLYGDLNLEPMGIGGIMNPTSVLQGLDPAVVPLWTPNRIANAGAPRALSQQLMRQAKDLSELAGGEVDLITASYGVRAAYEALLQNNVRYTAPMELEGGFKALEYDGSPLVVDRYHGSNRMEFIDLDEIDLYQLAELQWMEKDGAVLARVPGLDAYSATMFCYETVVTYQRNAHTELADITEPAGYTV